MEEWGVVTLLCFSFWLTYIDLGFVFGHTLATPSLTYRTGRVRELGDIEGNQVIDRLKTWYCTCCSRKEVEKGPKRLVAKGNLRGDGDTDALVDQQYTGCAGQEKVMSESVALGQERGVTGQTPEIAEQPVPAAQHDDRADEIEVPPQRIMMTILPMDVEESRTGDWEGY
ncbi:hypothetical protein BDW02DRAFT_576418 [Decorospora gaudefroyi]|uniref:Uncharacterized protein n=1 Tax=Decorospora gaudefroyi TaxID=184978 RepID=A0A6A5KTT2_9PLEO|nr:hypothetical protein BDW02DRAFT_576418 [Decorospora gaudefroyi]